MQVVMAHSRRLLRIVEILALVFAAFANTADDPLHPLARDLPQQDPTARGLWQRCLECNPSRLLKYVAEMHQAGNRYDSQVRNCKSGHSYVSFRYKPAYKWSREPLCRKIATNGAIGHFDKIWNR